MARARVSHPTGGRSRTKQSDALESDINKIINKFVAHIHVPEPGAPLPTYGDFSNVDDYHASMNKVRSAQQEFANLPAAVRHHVNNDPGEFLNLVHDPERIGELEELGLVEAQKPDSIREEEPPEPSSPDTPVEPTP